MKKKVADLQIEEAQTYVSPESCDESRELRLTNDGRNPLKTVKGHGR